MGLGASCFDIDAVRLQAQKGAKGKGIDAAAAGDAEGEALLAEPEPEAAATNTRGFTGHDLPKDEFDLIVIGGGSGGIALAKEAADHGGKVAVCDFVTPSPQGSKWGLGGTCVNVGCIPKKLMHTAGLMGHHIHDASTFGWNIPTKVDHTWKILTANVKAYIKSLNFGYKVLLKDNKIDYINAEATFLDANTIYTVNKKKKRTVKGKYIVVAVGGRPTYPDIPGAKKFGISSDDLFTLKKEPGKVLIVGAGYIALETSGFLLACYYDTTIMMRSIPLRGFDQQMASLVVEHMKSAGCKFEMKTVPNKLERDKETKRTRVYWNNSEGEEISDLFDTVLFATGRSPATKGLGLAELGVDLDPWTGHVIGGNPEKEQTTVPNIYAIGDVLKGCMELTPVAARAGRLLGRRLAGKSDEQMDYDKTATAVYSPLEYAVVGMAEEDAIEQYGQDNIEVYHAYFVPLEFALPKRNADYCYIKIVVDKTKDEEVLGFHMAGPNAGEIVQGFAVAIRCGVTYAKVISTVGIHPTAAEEFNRLYITKSSGVDPTVHSC